MTPDKALNIIADVCLAALKSGLFASFADAVQVNSALETLGKEIGDKKEAPKPGTESCRS